MVDRDLVLAKAGSVKKHLRRIIAKRNTDLESFLKDIDRQESILFQISQKDIKDLSDYLAAIFKKLDLVN